MNTVVRDQGLAKLYVAVLRPNREVHAVRSANSGPFAWDARMKHTALMTLVYTQDQGTGAVR